LLQSGR